MRSRLGASGAPPPDQQDHERRPGGDLGDDVRDRRSLDAETHPLHEHERQADAREVGDAQHRERGARVLEAPHPTLAGGRHEHERRAERGNPQPDQPLLVGRRGPACEQAERRIGECLDDHRGEESKPEREPRRLHTDVERVAPLPGSVQPRHLRRRPVLQHGHEAEGLGEQETAQRQPRERLRAHVSHDRRVAEHVQRLGRKRSQGGQREPHDRPQSGRVGHAGHCRGRLHPCGSTRPGEW